MFTRVTMSISMFAAVAIGCGEEAAKKVVLAPPAAGHGVQI
jgi:hypothetical protein